MSEQTQNTQQMLVIGLVVVAVLLAAIAGLLVWQKSNAIPEPDPAAIQQTPNATGATTSMPPGGSTGAPTGNNPGTGAAPTDVDPKAATEVPKGTEPEAYVKAYYAACEKGDWEAAFNALPADKKANNSPEQLKEQVSGYGVKSFAITAATVEGNSATIKADQVTASYGTFENTWTFTKKDGAWFVTGKAVTGMK